VETFRKRWPAARLFLLLGEDNVPKLSTWHRFADLQRWVTFVTFGRGTPENPAPLPEPAEPPFLGPRLRRRVDISSTEIRRRIAQDLPIRYLLPEPARLLIQSHALYKSTDQRAAGNFLRPVSPQ
jgi:nicotinate-nucleotide adenylyltransferase